MAATTAAELTYPEVGATSGQMPDGYRHVHRTVTVGDGFETLVRCGSALFGWHVHRRAGLTVKASAAVVEPDAVVVLGLGTSRVGVFSPCRVITVHSDDRGRGFTYGTLPGHAETGEESFEFSLDDRERLVFTIKAFSRPADLLARLGGQLGRRVQDRITDRYLRAAVQIGSGSEHRTA